MDLCRGESGGYDEDRTGHLQRRFIMESGPLAAWQGKASHHPLASHALQKSMVVAPQQRMGCQTGNSPVKELDFKFKL